MSMQPYEFTFVVIIVTPDKSDGPPLEAHSAGVFGSMAESQIVFDNVLSFSELVAKQIWQFDFAGGFRLQHQVVANQPALDNLTIADHRAVHVPAFVEGLSQYVSAMKTGKWKGVEKWMVHDKWIADGIAGLLQAADETPDAAAGAAGDGAPGDQPAQPS